MIPVPTLFTIGYEQATQAQVIGALKAAGVKLVIEPINHRDMPGYFLNTQAQGAAIVAQLRALEGHSFWPDDISLVDSDLVDCQQILTSAQVTDSYLLALAAKRGGRLATFDRKLSIKAVRGGKSALHVISGV